MGTLLVSKVREASGPSLLSVFKVRGLNVKPCVFSRDD